MKKDFYLDDWLVEPDLDRIRRNSASVRLRPQVMDLLVYLASRPREIVSNEEILSAVWSGRVTTPASVYNCLKEIRQALDDDPHDPAYIETIPKRGYRLIAPVKPVEDPENSGGRKLGRLTGRQLTIAAVATILAVAILLDRLGYREPVEDAAAPPIPDKSIAVLPFTDMSEEGDQAYFADGIAEEILDELAQSPDLKVIARSSSFAFRDRDEDLRSIGKKLGVAYVLEGSVRKDANQVRVTAQLADTRNGFHLWSEEYDREMGTILNIQDAIGTEVANALQVTLSRSDTSPEVMLGAEELDPRVYDLFLKAKNLINHGRKDSLTEAKTLLYEILEVDPDFHRARILLIDSTFNLAGEFGVWPDTDLVSRPAKKKELYSRLENEVREVISAEPELAEAYLLLGQLLHAQCYTDDAEQALLEALKINPNLAEAHRYLGSGIYHGTFASLNKVVASLRQAVELDPYSVLSRMQLARSLAAIPDLRAEKWTVFRDAQMVLPWTPFIGVTEARLLMPEGRYADAIRVLENTISREEYPPADAYLVNFWYWLGETGRAREIMPNYMLWRTDPDNDEVKDWNRCEGHPGDDPVYTGPWLTYVCMWHRRWSEAIDRMSYVSGPEELEGGRDLLAVQPLSAPVAVALAYKMTGNQALAEQYAAIEQAALDGRYEHGKIRNGSYTRYNARLLALRGEHEAALDELEAMLGFGNLNPWVFEHPVYDEIRNTPRFRQLQNRRIELVNVQRAQLGLDPLALLPTLPGT